jgi:hypothetical protein
MNALLEGNLELFRLIVIVIVIYVYSLKVIVYALSLISLDLRTAPFNH